MNAVGTLQANREAHGVTAADDQTYTQQVSGADPFWLKALPKHTC